MTTDEGAAVRLDPMFTIGNINGAMKYFDRSSPQFDDAIHEATDTLRQHITALAAERDALRERCARYGSTLQSIASCQSNHSGDVVDVARAALKKEG